MIRNPEPDKSAPRARDSRLAPRGRKHLPSLRFAESWIRVVAALVAVAVAVAGASGALIFSARGRASSFEKVRAWASVRRVELRLREDAPEEAARLAELVRCVEGSGPAGCQDAGWSGVLARAHRFTVEEADRRRHALDRWSEIEARASEDLARAREEMRTPGVGRREASLFRRAEVELATGRRSAAAGDLVRAMASAEVALGHAAAIHERWLEVHVRFRQPELLGHWRRLVTETLAGARRPGQAVLVVDKLERRLTVHAEGRLQAAFPVELGSRSLDRKLHAGDQATPEGRYRVTRLKVAPETRYYKALLLDYPNVEDHRRFAEAKSRGQVPAGRGIGSLIEIHGDGGQGSDWTNGCVALTNDDMDRLFRYVKVGTPVTIVGTVPKDVDVP